MIELGARNDSAYWFCSEAPAIGRGRRTWLRVGRLTFQWEAEFLRFNEWGLYFRTTWHGYDWFKLELGPGVIPF